VYDLESELRRRARGELEVSDCVRQVLTETAPGYRGALSQPWDDWVWRWRELPAEERRTAISSALWPAVRASLKRSKLRKMASLPQTPLRVWNREPGPRDPAAKWRAPVVAPPPPATVEEAVASTTDPELLGILQRLMARGVC
jgi:hypothetical protein